MTLTKGVALSLFVTTAGALATVPGRAAGGSATSPRLTAISSRVHGKGASLVIEATAPVPYVATRPDPLTVLIDFRNVAAEGLANSVAMNVKSPIAGVDVEPVEALGAPTSRVRVVLSQPVEYRVRSDRNTIVVDFDKLKPGPYVAPAMRATGTLNDPLKALEANAPIAADPIAALGLDGRAAAANKEKPVEKKDEERKPLSATALLAPKLEVARTPAATFTAPAKGESSRLEAVAKLEAASKVEPAPAGQAAGSATVRPTQPPQPVGEQRAGTRRYTGHPISLDFQGADLRSVLRVFAEES